MHEYGSKSYKNRLHKKCLFTGIHVKLSLTLYFVD